MPPVSSAAEVAQAKHDVDRLSAALQSAARWVHRGGEIRNVQAQAIATYLLDSGLVKLKPEHTPPPMHNQTTIDDHIDPARTSTKGPRKGSGLR